MNNIEVIKQLAKQVAQVDCNEVDCDECPFNLGYFTKKHTECLSAFISKRLRTLDEGVE